MRLPSVPLPVLLLAAAVLLTACSMGPSGGAGSGDSPVPTTPLVDRSGIRVPTPKQPTSTPTTLTGRVSEGVEAGCTVLTTDAGRVYTLTGAVERLGSAGPVTVRGHVDPELMSHCMQGPVFVVSEVESATP